MKLSTKLLLLLLLIGLTAAVVSALIMLNRIARPLDVILLFSTGFLCGAAAKALVVKSKTRRP